MVFQSVLYSALTLRHAQDLVVFLYVALPALLAAPLLLCFVLELPATAAAAADESEASEQQISKLIAEKVDNARSSNKIAVPASHVYPSFAGRKMRPACIRDLQLSSFWFAGFRSWEPVFVIKKSNSHYIVVGGNHRVEAARRTGVLVVFAHVIDLSYHFFVKYKRTIALALQNTEVINDEFTVVEQLRLLKDCMDEWRINHPASKLTFKKCRDILFKSFAAHSEYSEELKKRHFMFLNNKAYFRGAKHIFAASEPDGTFSVLDYLENFEKMHPGIAPWTRNCILQASSLKDSDGLLAEVKRWRDTEKSWLDPLLKSRALSAQDGSHSRLLKSTTPKKAKCFSPLLTQSIVNRIERERDRALKRAAEAEALENETIQRLPKIQKVRRRGPREQVFLGPCRKKHEGMAQASHAQPPLHEHMQAPRFRDRQAQKMTTTDSVSVQSGTCSSSVALRSLVKKRIERKSLPERSAAEPRTVRPAPQKGSTPEVPSRAATTSNAKTLSLHSGSTPLRTSRGPLSKHAPSLHGHPIRPKHKSAAEHLATASSILKRAHAPSSPQEFVVVKTNLNEKGNRAGVNGKKVLPPIEKSLGRCTEHKTAEKTLHSSPQPPSLLSQAGACRSEDKRTTIRRTACNGFSFSSPSGEILTLSSVESERILQNDQWLCDRSITFIVSTCVEWISKEAHRVHWVQDSTAVGYLLEKHCHAIPENDSILKNCRRQWNLAWENDAILFGLNGLHHWSLVLVCGMSALREFAGLSTCEMTRRKEEFVKRVFLFTMDSLTDHHKKHIAKPLAQVFALTVPVSSAEECSQQDVARHMIDLLSPVTIKVPKQSDCTSCGWHVARNAAVIIESGLHPLQAATNLQKNSHKYVIDRVLKVDDVKTKARGILEEVQCDVPREFSRGLCKKSLSDEHFGKREKKRASEDDTVIKVISTEVDPNTILKNLFTVYNKARTKVQKGHTHSIHWEAVSEATVNLFQILAEAENEN